ncbi:MAG: MBL fold metallo-hydrolase [Deltaproteobacteria bacterium]|nr:MBL fold metallo-hydrolase [Deltaproteobacteria bacterium]
MRITERVHALKLPFQVTTPAGVKIDRYVYVYVIFGKRIILVDSGVANSERAIFEYIRKEGRDPEDISCLLLTHSHPDHIGAARAVKEATGCSVHAHQYEKSWIENVELQAKERPVPGFDALVGGSVTVDRLLEAGEKFEMDENILVDVFHTPGHSKGSISLRLQPEGILFTGDAIPVPGDIPIYEDVESTVRSIKILMNLEGTRYLLASWDDPRQGEKIDMLFRSSLEYLRRIYDAVSKVAVPGLAPMELCLRVLDDIGLPKAVANPLLAAAFVSHSKVRAKNDLFIA